MLDTRVWQLPRPIARKGALFVSPHAGGDEGDQVQGSARVEFRAVGFERQVEGLHWAAGGVVGEGATLVIYVVCHVLLSLGCLSFLRHMSQFTFVLSCTGCAGFSVRFSCHAGRHEGHHGDQEDSR